MNEYGLCIHFLVWPQMTYRGLNILVFHAKGITYISSYFYLFALSSFTAGPDSNDLSGFIKNDFVDRLVQHVRTAVDGAQAGKSLRQFAETIKGIQIGRLAISGQRIAVELDLLERQAARNLEIGVVPVKG